MRLQTLKNINTVLKIFRDKEQLSNDVRVDCDEIVNIFTNIISDVEKSQKAHPEEKELELTYPFRVRV